MKYFEGLNRILSKKVVQHILFWSFFITIEILHAFDKGEPGDYRYWLLRYFISLAGSAIAVYVNLRLLIPYFLKKNRFYFYLPLLFAIIAICGYIINLGVDQFEGLDYEVMDGESGGPKRGFIIAGQTVMMVILSSLIHFTKEWIKLKDVKLELQEAEKAKLAAELQTLKAQVNPHFLFNTLNNIYSLSLDKSDKSPEMILKLSDLMSYMIYEGREEMVTLEKEFEFLNNYINLEKIRVEDHIDIKIQGQSDFSGRLVSPLLFVPFVENAFKYVSDTPGNKAFINIDMNEDGEAVYLKVENSYDETNRVKSDKKHGIGIKNVKKRLSLIYPEMHKLEIIETDNIYMVELKINLS